MALPNDMSRTTDMVAGATASNPNFTANSKKAARNLIRKTYTLGSVASVLANGDDAIVANAAPSVYFKNAVRVMGVTIQPRVAMVESASDIQTFSLKPISALGVIGNTIATGNTDTVASGGVGNIDVGQSFSLTVDTTYDNNRLAAGTWVGVAIAPSGNGVVVGATSWAIDVEEEGPDGYAV